MCSCLSHFRHCPRKRSLKHCIRWGREIWRSLQVHHGFKWKVWYRQSIQHPSIWIRNRRLWYWLCKRRGNCNCWNAIRRLHIPSLWSTCQRGCQVQIQVRWPILLWRVNHTYSMWCSWSRRCLPFSESRSFLLPRPRIGRSGPQIPNLMQRFTFKFNKI